MAAGDVAYGVGHRQHSKTEGERNADEPDPEEWCGSESRSQNGRTNTAENQPERAKNFCGTAMKQARRHRCATFF